MTMLRPALLGICISWIPLCGSAMNDSDECGDTQMEMNECAARKFRAADAELNRLYKEQMSRLESEATRSRLRAAQRAWISFRDLSCEYEWPADNQGSIGPLVIAGCKTYYSQQRIEDLRRYLDCSDEGCPR